MTRRVVGLVKEVTIQSGLLQSSGLVNGEEGLYAFVSCFLGKVSEELIKKEVWLSHPQEPRTSVTWRWVRSHAPWLDDSSPHLVNTCDVIVTFGKYF